MPDITLRSYLRALAEMTGIAAAFVCAFLCAAAVILPFGSWPMIVALTTCDGDRACMTQWTWVLCGWYAAIIIVAVCARCCCVVVDWARVERPPQDYYTVHGRRIYVSKIPPGGSSAV